MVVRYDGDYGVDMEYLHHHGCASSRSTMVSSATADETHRYFVLDDEVSTTMIPRRVEVMGSA